jgi:hypothetical protein
MIALDRRLDQARGIAGWSLELILTEADGYHCLRPAAEGGVSP